MLTRIFGVLAIVFVGCTAACTAGCTLGRVHGTSSSRTGSAGPVQIDLAPYVAGLRVVQVTIAGHTHPFLFDSGGGLVILTPKVAAELGCSPVGRLVGFRFDGGRLDGQRCSSAELSLGGWRTRVEDVGVFDIMSMLGNSPEVGGIVGLPAFESVPFTLDLAANHLTIETPISLAARISTMREIRVRPSRQSGGASLDLFVAVEAAHTPIWLEVDSGNTGDVLLSQPALAQIGVQLADGSGRALQLNVAGFGPIGVSARAVDSIYDGLLNAKFLESVVITIDLPHMRAWMAARPVSGSPQTGS